jgi:hypothetical protein
LKIHRWLQAAVNNQGDRLGRPDFPLSLLAQISQVLLHRLQLELELSQVGFQLLDLLSLGKKLALETAISTAAFAAAVAFPFIAITLFVHFLTPLDGFTIYKFWFLRLLMKRLLKPGYYILFPWKPPHADQPAMHC